MAYYELKDRWTIKIVQKELVRFGQRREYIRTTLAFWPIACCSAARTHRYGRQGVSQDDDDDAGYGDAGDLSTLIYTSHSLRAIHLFYTYVFACCAGDYGADGEDYSYSDSEEEGDEESDEESDSEEERSGSSPLPAAASGSSSAKWIVRSSWHFTIIYLLKYI